MKFQPYQTEEFAPLAECINNDYEANLITIIRRLDNAIFLFHFLDEAENIPNLYRRNTTNTLNHMKESFMEMYYNHMGWKVLMRSKDL